MSSWISKSGLVVFTSNKRVAVCSGFGTAIGLDVMVLESFWIEIKVALPIYKRSGAMRPSTICLPSSFLICILLFAVSYCRSSVVNDIL